MERPFEAGGKDLSFLQQNVENPGKMNGNVRKIGGNPHLQKQISGKDKTFSTFWKISKIIWRVTFYHKIFRKTLEIQKIYENKTG